MRTVRAHAFAYRASELLLGPLTDAGFGIGRDVRGIDFSERRLEGQTAGVRRSARRRVTTHTVAGASQIAAPLY